MAAPTPVNPSSLPPDVTRVFRLSCGSDALRDAHKKLLTLEDCERILVQAEAEARAAISGHRWARGLELAARSVLVACDVGIMVLEDRVGPVGKAISKLYDGGKLVVDAFTGSVDERAAFKQLAKNKADLAALTVEMGGAPKAARAIGAMKNIVETADLLWEQVTGAAKGNDGAAGIESARRTVLNQLASIRAKIAQLRADLEKCAPAPLA